MIHVIAAIEILQGHRDAFLDEFRKLVPLVRAEEGCIEYGPALDIPSGIPVQNPLRPNVITVVEKWGSLDHLKAHLVAPHMLDYRARVAHLVVRTTLDVLAPA